MNHHTSFEQYIRQYCRKNNQTIEQLADMSGISRGTFYNILKKGSDPKLSYIIQISHVLGVHYTTLLNLKYQDLESLFATKAKLGVDQSAFIHETPPDGSVISPGCEFIKTWTIENVGNQVWEGRSLVCMDENYISHLCLQLPFIDDYLLIPENRCIALPITNPGEQVTISIKFTAPKIAGCYISYWKMINEQGKLCFPNGVGLSTMIVVKTLAMAH